MISKIAKRPFYYFIRLSEILYSITSNIFANIYLKLIGVKFSIFKIKFDRIPLIILQPNSTLLISDNVIFTSSIKSNPIGMPHKCIIALLTDESVVKIGKNTGLTGVSICAKKSIEIGENVFIGGGVAIWDTDFHPVDCLQRKINPNDGKTLPVKIGNNVFIGARSIILKGVTIGDGAVIGAGSVVSSSVKSNEIYAGNPAKKIGNI